jgi:hypothetical protein
MAKQFEEDFLGNFLSQSRVAHDCARRRKHCPVVKREGLIKTYDRVLAFCLARD